MGSHHHHHHHHGLDHSHHDHAHQEVTGRLILAFALNLIFACIELAGGFYTNSMAVLTDALHDFGDATALGLAMVLEKKSQKSSDDKYSYGYRRLSTVSAFITGVILIVGSVLIISKSIPRLVHPEQPHTTGMVLLAFLGIAVNGFAFFKVSKGESLNERMIAWHFIEDLTGWILLLIGALIMKFWDIPVIDPILAILLATWVLWNVSKTLKETMRVFMQAIPSGIKIEEIEDSIKAHDQVLGAHHTHVWSIDGQAHVLTTHIVLDQEVKDVATISTVKKDIKKMLLEKYSIHESNLEFDISLEECADPQHSN